MKERRSGLGELYRRRNTLDNMKLGEHMKHNDKVQVRVEE